ncbi:lysoplasmalogenase [Paenibacillus motobuensis]|uniref:lysoplasmalogenase n=1 Tax=Paenibacillus TaxID=44249 RepID=UPI00203DB610|nr:MULTISPECIES: lysoplasmalogenase [Paenibacillus]MCM3040353.1 lysoplasmalogenase [Paenibacillus lutimineralis]MCM3647457.1 lysoplasmalogenase [Paenibacillus motobuensis]
MFKRTLAVLILIMGLIYIFVSSALIFKLIPMWLILLYAYLQRSRLDKRYVLLVITGLFFCMLGDGLLSHFIIGLSAFLIGHLFYTAAFITKWKFSWVRLCTIIPFLIYAGIMANQLVRAMQNTDNEGLIIPVMIYLLIILSMGWFSIMSGNIWSMIGSTLFIISDSILAWNKFVSEVTYSGVMIMLTYYTAQFLIANSVGQRGQRTDASNTNSLAR